MDKSFVEFMVVEDRFAIADRFLVLAPEFDIPEMWKNFSEEIVLVTPSGEEKIFEAVFAEAHVNIPDMSVPLSERWKVLIRLPHATKEDVPIGSKVFGPAYLLNKLNGTRP